MRGAILALTLALTSCLALTNHDGHWHCAANSDCSGGDVCQSFHGSQICAPAGYCEQSYDCAPSMSCNANLCTAPSCTSNADCGAYICVKSVCLVQCATSADCSSKGLVCTMGQCEPPPCTSDAQCGGFRCISGACGGTCGSDLDCAPGYSCTSAGQCGPRTCTNGMPGQCGGLACNSGTCLTSCKTDSDCDPGRTCSGGACVGCSGAASACSQQTNCAAPGCMMTTLCSGGYIDCQVFDGAQGSCDAVIGCSFDTYTNACTGGPTCAGQTTAGCTVLANAGACIASTGCTGTPTACASLTVAQCTNTVGCALQ